MADTSKAAIARYVDRCAELSEGGEYSWWADLASLISALEAERDALRTQVALANDPAYLATAIDKVGMVDKEWKARAEAAEALNAKAAEALEPFAKCSEVYPGADPEAEAAFGSMYDPRCPLKLGDFHWARSTLSTLRETTNDQT